MLARRRLPEGLDGVAQLHALLAEHALRSWEQLSVEQTAERVVIGIETDRGAWVAALRAAGYQSFAINPMSVARYRERHSTSGAKSDAGDAHVLADLVRLDRSVHRPVAEDSDLAEAVKLLARAHQTAIWERTRHLLRLRSALLEFFPAALQAFADLHGQDALDLLKLAPTPDAAAALTPAQVEQALRRARRRDVATKAERLRELLSLPGLRQPPVVEQAYASIVRTQVRLIRVLNDTIKETAEFVEARFGQHPDAEIYLSQPGLGAVLGARVLGKFGDDKHCYRDGRARKNYSGQSPITRASGKRTVVLARYAVNNRLSAALHQQAFCALTGSPGTRAYYDALRARKIGHHAGLRQVANRLVGILHGCLRTGSSTTRARPGDTAPISSNKLPLDSKTAWGCLPGDGAPVGTDGQQEPEAVVGEVAEAVSGALDLLDQRVGGFGRPVADARAAGRGPVGQQLGAPGVQRAAEPVQLGHV